MADRTTERGAPVYRRGRRIARLCHFVDERVAALGLNGVALAMEDSPGRGDLMPLPPLVRRYFPDEIIRWRAPLGVRTYNEYGEYNVPEMARSLLAALVQPQEDVNDSATEGGLLYTNRVVVFVPIAAQDLSEAATLSDGAAPLLPGPVRRCRGAVDPAWWTVPRSLCLPPTKAAPPMLWISPARCSRSLNPNYGRGAIAVQ